MKYAIIALQGKQYRVEEGVELTVDRLSQDADKVFTIADVLLVVDGENVAVGQPKVANAKVSAKVLKHQRGEKIRVSVFKAKSRYRRTHGHRQEETVVKIEKISST